MKGLLLCPIASRDAIALPRAGTIRYRSLCPLSACWGTDRTDESQRDEGSLHARGICRQQVFGSFPCRSSFSNISNAGIGHD